MYFGTDSAISTKINDNIYRLSEDGQKIWIIDNQIIFCSGRMEIVKNIMSKFLNQCSKSINDLKNIAKEYYEDYIINNNIVSETFLLDILIGNIKHKQSIVYQISPYNDFQIIERKILLHNQFGIWTGGIKTRELFNIAHINLVNNKTIQEVYQNTFDFVSYEGIGGNLFIYKLDNKNGCQLYYNNKIKEKDIQYINVDLCKQLIVAEQVYGKLGIFASVRANQIIVGDQGERLSNEVIANTAFINNSSYLKFDDSGQIKINYNQIFNQYPITIEAIVQTNYYDVVGRSICHKFSNNNGFDLFLYNNKINAFYYLDSTNRVRIFNVSGLEINDNKLHHISFVVDNTGGKIYIDGVLKHHNNWEGTSGVITNVDDLYIGRRGLNGSTFEGNIFEVRLWDSARTKEQIKENLFIQLDGDESNLIGYWKLNEGAGSTAKDSTSNNNHGIIETPVWRGKTSDALGNLRSDLNMSAPLPTSITLNNEGIRASTVTPDKYAQLDYRGLYIKNGAIQIDGSDGKTNYITGKYIDLGNAGLSNEGTAVGDIRIWAGSSYENRLTAPFKVNQQGQLTATSATITGNIIATSGTFSGTVYASSGSFTGNIDCSSLKINGTNVLSGSNKILGDHIESLSAGKISAGTITASVTIESPTITGGTITGSTVRTAASGTRVVLTSNYADIDLYHGSVNILKILDDLDGCTIYSPANYLQLGAISTQVNAEGNWNFSNASVSGISVTAVFG